jgi:hypothetical protein
VTKIAACPDLSERDAELADLLDGQGHQRQADAPALALRVDRHHVDLTRPLAIGSQARTENSITGPTSLSSSARTLTVTTR